jgi:hypothetical protein
MILLLTTSTGSPDRLADLARLIGSLAAARHGHALRHLVLLQNGVAYPGFVPEWCEIVSYSGKLSLSAARNRLFAHVGPALAQADIVGFPDDDAWYSEAWLDVLAARFAEHRPELLLTRYATTPSETPAAAPVLKLSPARIIYWTASPSMFVSGRAAARAARFDTRLSVGPGAIWNGGEDTDFAMRAAGTEGGVMLDAACVGHRDRIRQVALNYIVGNTFVIARHVKRHPSLVPLLLKKWAIFMGFAAIGQVPLSRLGPFLRAQGVALAGKEVIG